MTSVPVSVSDTEDRSLVTVETIISLQPIDGADLIELAQVRGWCAATFGDDCAR